VYPQCQCLGYLSRLAIRQIKEKRNLIEIRGSFLFADLSGFTAMSDRLSASGRLGSEELASAINRIFDPLLEIIFSYDGDVIKFGGDAVLVLFAGEDHAYRAAECGFSLLESIGTSDKVTTSVGDFPIAVHIGISCGSALSAIVGSNEGRCDHLFCGPDVSLAYAAADRAAAGELLVTENCLPYLKTCAGHISAAGRFLRMNKPADNHNQCAIHDDEAIDIEYSHTKPFLAAGLWEKITLSSDGKIEGEHRHITTMFIGIDGWHKNLVSRDVNRGGYYGPVNDHIVHLFSITEKYGGNIVRLDLTDAGEKALVLFGAPVLRENAPVDALRAALEMKKTTIDISRALPELLKIRIGINSGISYVGDVGGSLRREYTAMGKEVNLAARLMTKADWGEIIAGPATLEMAGKLFRTEVKGRFSLKGVKEPVVLERVVAEKSILARKKASLNLVGREKEIEVLDRFVAGVSASKGGLVQIFGEAGSGKSALMEKACSDLLRGRITVLQTACFQHTSNTPLHPLGEILRKSMEIGDEDSRKDRKRKLRSALEKVGGLEWEGLVCRLVGYTIKPTPEISNLSETAKRNKTFQLISSLLLLCCDRNPACVVVDDLHWSDATTIEFLNSYAKILAENRIGFLLVSRFSEHIPRYHYGTITDLELLDDDSSVRLFRSVLKREAPDEFVAEIVKASGGNPFYLEEMAKAIRDMGMEAWSESMGVPDSVERVITARIDRLDEMVKTTVRTASVIGRIFGLEDLIGIFPLPQNKSGILGYLDKSAALDITPLEHTEPVVEYGFKHILTKEVAYSGLSYKSRRMLHLALARYYRVCRRSRGLGPELIGYHYERTETPISAIPYYMLAGRAAGRAFSNPEAIFYFKKVLDLLGPDGNPKIICRANLGLGRVYKLIGEYDKAEQHLKISSGSDANGEIWGSEALRELSELYRIKSEFDKASAVLKQLLEIDEGNPAYQAIYENGMGEIARRSGNLEPALNHFSLGLRHKDDIEPGLAAQILNNMGICLWMLGRLDEALLKYEDAKEIYANRRDLQGIAKISNNSGIIREQKGNLAGAAESYREAAAVFERIGDIRSQGFCYGNLATNFISRGLPDTAREHIDRTLQLFEKIGDHGSYALTIGNLADWYYLIGDHDAAMRVCERTVQLADELKNDELICETNIRKARLMLMGDADKAVAMMKRAYKESVKKKWHDLELKAEFYLLEWEILNGRCENAESALLKMSELKKKNPPPEFVCGIYKLGGLLQYIGGDRKAARISLMAAYSIARKSDLVYDSLEILNLYGSLWPGHEKPVEKKLKDLKLRIFENLDEPAIQLIKARLKRRLNLYYAQVGPVLKKRPTAVRIR
jgi:class 3 adenylate cyclase/tetratricopeptide (TPR) repeat protein